jgi:hypothetical protein
MMSVEYKHFVALIAALLFSVGDRPRCSMFLLLSEVLALFLLQ